MHNSKSTLAVQHFLLIHGSIESDDLSLLSNASLRLVLISSIYWVRSAYWSASPNLYGCAANLLLRPLISNTLLVLPEPIPSTLDLSRLYFYIACFWPLTPLATGCFQRPPSSWSLTDYTTLDISTCESGLLNSSQSNPSIVSNFAFRSAVVIIAQLLVHCL